MTDRLWSWDSPTDQRATVRDGTSVTGVIGLVLVLAWAAALLVATSHAAPIDASYRAALDRQHDRPLLPDPPLPVARADFLVGALHVAAFPVSLATALLGGHAIAAGWVRGRGVGRVAFFLGIAALVPSFYLVVFGVVTCLFSWNALTGIGGVSS